MMIQHNKSLADNKQLKEDLVIAKSVNHVHKSKEFDHALLLAKLENILRVLTDLNRGKPVDLDLLTSNNTGEGLKNEVKMVHFNKALT